MNAHLEDLVFIEVDSIINKIIQAADTQNNRLLSKEIIINNNSSQSDGTIWSPQLDSYKEWVSHHDKIQELGFKQAVKEAQKNAEKQPSDLLSSGSLHFGNAEMYRQKIIEEALRPKKNEENTEKKIMHNFQELQEGFIFTEKEDAFVLSELNLHAIARYLGTNKNIVIILPDFIDNKPVTEIAPNVCIRRNSQGVQVKLLYTPKHLKKIAQDTFSSIQCAHIHIGSELTEFKEQHFSRSNYVDGQGSLNFSVNTDNRCYKLLGTYLVSQDEEELFYAPEPYPTSLELPQTLKHIHANSFIEDAELPELVICPPKLESQKSKALNDSLWVCPQDAPIYETLKLRGARLASHRVIKQDDCWFDLNEKSAALVLGPRAPLSASKRFARIQALKSQNAQTTPTPTQTEQILSLPSTVETKTVRLIAERALLHTPKTLIIPDSVEIIEDGNSAKGLERLILSKRLKKIGERCFCSRSINNIIDIPSSVHSIGKASFEFCKIRLEQVNTVVHISQDQMKSCFIDALEGELPFDFLAYDELLSSNAYLPDKLGALLARLAGDYPLDERTKNAIIDQLLSQKSAVNEKIAQNPNATLIDALMSSRFIQESNIDDLLEVLRRHNRKNEIIKLMNFKQTNCGTQKSNIKAKFDL